MYSGRFVFPQLMGFFPLPAFRRCVQRYRGHYKVQRFSCLDQFLCMAFAQLTGRESLRDIETCLRARQPNFTMSAFALTFHGPPWPGPTRTAIGAFLPSLPTSSFARRDGCTPTTTWESNSNRPPMSSIPAPSICVFPCFLGPAFVSAKPRSSCTP